MASSNSYLLAGHRNCMHIYDPKIYYSFYQTIKVLSPRIGLKIWLTRSSSWTWYVEHRMARPSWRQWRSSSLKGKNILIVTNRDVKNFHYTTLFAIKGREETHPYCYWLLSWIGYKDVCGSGVALQMLPWTLLFVWFKPALAVSLWIDKLKRLEKTVATYRMDLRK